MIARFVLVGTLLATSFLTTPISSAPIAPARLLRDVKLNFESLPGRRLPSSWELDGWGFTEGYRCDVTLEAPHAGNYCLMLRYDGEGEPAGSGRVSQKLDAAEYRGKRVAFRAAVRIFDAGSSARLLLEGVTRDKRNVLIAGTVHEPIRSAEWRVFEVVGDVGTDIVELEMGISHRGRGRVLVDDIELTVLGDLPDAKPLPAQVMEDRTVDNVVVLARLLGLLRYYHPSDQAAQADWESLARAGVIAVEDASGLEDLCQRLETFFAPIAPTLRVFPSAHRPRKKSEWLEQPESSEDHWVVRWQHTGLDETGAGGELFASERQREPFKGRLPRRWLRPEKPSDYDVGAYVTARLATTLYADAEGTLPHTDTIEAMGALPIEASAGFSALDRATRISSVLMAWNALQHFGPLLDEAEADWPKLLETAIRAASEDESEKALLSTLRQMIAGLGDGQARIDHRSDWRASNIPVAWDWVEDKLVITRIADGERGKIGVGLGDVVLQVSGRPAMEIYEETCLEFSGATERFVRELALDSMLRRGRGDQVTMRINSASGKRIDINYKDPFSRAALSDKRPAQYAEVEDGVFYVDLARVRGVHIPELLKAVESAKAVVFDLRDGIEDLSRRALIAHLIDSPIKDIEWRLPVSTRPNQDKLTWDKRTEKITPIEPKLDAKFVFLSDGSVTGEAEALLALVVAEKLGACVGEASGGTIGLVNEMLLPGDYRLQWTASLAKLPNGETLYGKGIKPTKRVSRTIAGVTAGKDELLEAAIKLLK